MSASPDPVDAAAPLDPAAYRARPLMGPMFWAMIALTLVAVIAGVVVVAMWNLAPRLKAVEAQSRAPAALVRAEDRPVSAQPTAYAPPPLATSAPGALTAITQRLAALEDQQARTAQAAAAVLAGAALVEASQTSRPFPEELAAVQAAAPSSGELRALQRLAERGAPSRAALTSSFPEYAARAASASRAPGDDAGLGARIVHALTRVVTLRRVGDVPGTGVDATLARAERLIGDGDIDQALRVLDALPPAGREALADWRGRAERRAEIDRQVAALRLRALEDLAAIARQGG